MDALFVVVVVVLVFVQGEVSVGTRVDAQFDGVFSLFGGPLHGWTEGEDRAGAHVEREFVEWCLGLKRLFAVQLLAGPEVVPGCFGQIDGTALRPLYIDRVHQDRWAEEEFIAGILRSKVGSPIHDQRAHQRAVLARYSPCL